MWSLRKAAVAPQPNLTCQTFQWWCRPRQTRWPPKWTCTRHCRRWCCERRHRGWKQCHHRHPYEICLRGFWLWVAGIPRRHCLFGACTSRSPFPAYTPLVLGSIAANLLLAMLWAALHWVSSPHQDGLTSWAGAPFCHSSHAHTWDCSAWLISQCLGNHWPPRRKGCSKLYVEVNWWSPWWIPPRPAVQGRALSFPAFAQPSSLPCSWRSQEGNFEWELGEPALRRSLCSTKSNQF